MWWCRGYLPPFHPQRPPNHVGNISSLVILVAQNCNESHSCIAFWLLWWSFILTKRYAQSFLRKSWKNNKDRKCDSTPTWWGWSKFFLYNSISRCRMRSWCYYRSSSQNDAAKTLLCAKNNCLGDIYDWWFDLKDFLYHHQFTVFDNIFKLAFDALLLYNHWRSLNLNGTIVIKIQWQKLASILLRISPGKKKGTVNFLCSFFKSFLIV